MPKGVELSNYSLLLNAQIQNSLDVNMVAMWFSSLYWVTGVTLSIRSIVHGVKAIIYPYFDEEMTYRLIQKYKVSRCCVIILISLQNNRQNNATGSWMSR